jgi:hypothetical protein
MATSTQVQWKPITTIDPPERVTVLTRIDDGYGARNECRLYRQGRLWFLADGSMYVYYTPTHYAEEK